MKINSIRIQNFKSLHDTGWIKLSPTKNVLVGQNNSGKTAFLQSFRFNDNQPNLYRGPKLPAWPPNSGSLFQVRFKVSGSELRDKIIKDSRTIFIPTPDPVDQNEFIEHFFNKDAITISVQAIAAPGSGFSALQSPSHNLFGASIAHQSRLVQYDFTTDRFVAANQVHTDGLPGLVENLRAESIYVFDPERLKIGSCTTSETAHLDPSARNLPAVLATMSRNPAKWERFKHHVREVFPSIRDVAVSPLGAEIAVYVWQNIPSEDGADYAVLLQESGTGVAQVLSILYVAMARSGSIIVIDEPNSFLHPGAAKKLMAILNKYSDNQYIISTHSPELISVIDPEVLLSTSWYDGRTSIDVLDRQSLNDIEKILLDLGCELSDVFSVDRVVWCEGPTEVGAFPIIARLAGLSLVSTKFLRLRATGDVFRKGSDVKAVLDIYGILGSVSSLLPRQSVFNLDREGKSSREIDDLSRYLQGRVRFLPARTLENFVIDADAISVIISEDYASTNTDSAPPDKSQVNAWISSNFANYRAADNAEESDLFRIDAPSLLDDLFKELTGNLHIYRKTSHTVRLLEWLQVHKPERTEGLVQYICSLLS
ncbi:AAA family ATPase [Sphingomonas sp. BK235]|uniref:AAA family ATPase n=1 Tax=Sphingomonas sp. BK235 TaxID=2512131 RepID=UPI0010E559A7|nr:AAA family ATPase [Sphingomonas sp. BK235]TCP33254.1 putative ATPase [Sphingomonas sp. BK235]